MNDNTVLGRSIHPEFDPVLHELAALDLRILSETALPPYEARAVLASMHIIHGCYATILMLGDEARATIMQMLEQVDWTATATTLTHTEKENSDAT